MNDLKSFAIAGTIALSVFLLMNLFGIAPQMTGYAIVDENLTITVNNPEQNSEINITHVTLSVTTNYDANCKYDNNAMLTTGSTLHLQPLTELTEGQHSYNIECSNENYTAQTTIAFTVIQEEQILQQQENQTNAFTVVKRLGNLTDAIVLPSQKL